LLIRTEPYHSLNTASIILFAVFVRLCGQTARRPVQDLHGLEKRRTPGLPPARADPARGELVSGLACFFCFGVPGFGGLFPPRGSNDAAIHPRTLTPTSKKRRYTDSRDIDFALAAEM
ncbi:MAG: hypothetical protein R6V85_02575, partial [Polyangia bacterium]